MKELDKLFESLDEKVFTTELKESLSASFNEAVQEKAKIIAEERIEEEIDALSEKSDEHIAFLTEQSEEFVKDKQEAMLEAVDKYLERVVEEFVLEAKESLHESAKAEKADMIIEAFDTMLVATGVEVARIAEGKDESSIEAELKESKEKYDTLIDENIALKEETDKLIKMGVISEMKEGLSLVEAEKFGKLAAVVEFVRDDSYADKLQTLKESLKGAVSEETNLNESDATKQGDKPVWAHLV